MSCKLLHYDGDISVTPPNRLQQKEAEMEHIIEENKQLKQSNNSLEKQVDTLEERIDQLLDQTVVGVTNIVLSGSCDQFP